MNCFVHGYLVALVVDHRVGLRSDQRESPRDFVRVDHICLDTETLRTMQEKEYRVTPR